MMLFALGFFVSSAMAQNPLPAELDTRITHVDGSATVTLHDHPDAPVAAAEGAPLASGDRILTGKDGRVELGIDGNSAVELGPNTDFTVTSADRKAASFSLAVGSFFAKIKAGLFGDGSLEVRSPDSVASVRGTEFAVETAGAGQPAFVAVFDEGKVAVRGLGAPGELLLARDQETTVAPGKPPLAATPLARFLARREIIARLRLRALKLRAIWKAMTREQRLAARARFFEERRELEERRENRLRRRIDRRPPPRRER